MKMMHLYMMMILVLTNMMYASERPENTLDHVMLCLESKFNDNGIVSVENNLGLTKVNYWDQNILKISIFTRAVRPDLFKNISIKSNINQSSATIKTFYENSADAITDGVFVDCYIHAPRGITLLTIEEPRQARLVRQDARNEERLRIESEKFVEEKSI
ncbi:MAG: hypothetical protein JO129_02160 [Candidatus Dependentiae bacterium]|nr:hypothetical protein [Candidatus Dependentiae bacterium]